MLKTRLILLISAVTVTGALYLLPKAVVENDADSMADSTVQAAPGHEDVTAGQQASINALRVLLTDETSKERNNPIFADSLGSLYAAAGRPDSSAMWFERASLLDPNSSRVLKAADAWYLAHDLSLDPEVAAERAGRAQQLYKRLLEKSPQDADLKVKLAMTYMSSAAPMQGVTMLREVLAAQPEHEQALLNMGKLSIRSGQYAKAVDWLSRLTKAHPENLEGQLLFGKALAETGEKEQARAQYERTRKMTNDPAVQQQLEQFIKELN